MPVAVNSAAVLAPATPWGDTLDQYADAADQQRRDGDLAVRGSGPILASGEWPEPAVPSLADWQYLTLPQDARTILYFDPYYGSRWDGGWRPWPGRRAYRP